jgi:hypothetical protein
MGTTTCRGHLARDIGLILIDVIGMRTAIPVLYYLASVFIMLEAATDVLPFIIFSALSL